MSIDKVEILNAQGNLLSLSLEDISGGYIVKDIDGLDPVKATLVSSNFAGLDGEEEHASYRETRNIVIKLGYNPNVSIGETVRVLRSRLYNFFMAPSKVVLTFYMLDGLVVTARGTVESCEASLFSAEPEANISVVCFDPDFVEEDPTQLHDVFTTIDTSPQIITVNGTVDTGLDNLSFTAAKAMSEFTIYHTTPGGELRTMLVSAPLLAGDLVVMRTIPRQKSITMTRAGVVSSLMWAVSPQSKWVLLKPGPNQFYVAGTATGPSAPIFVDFHNRYGGL